MLENLQKVNKIPILPIHDKSFKIYGNVLSGYDFNTLCSAVKKEIAIPKEGTDYVAELPCLENLAVSKKIKECIFGGMDIQVGYCCGQNSRLNGLEYHKGNEIIVAVTPMVLLLASITDIQDFSKIDSNTVKAFYVEENEAVELHGTTLHFAPCKAVESGFLAVIILPKGTNLPLDYAELQSENEAKLLWMKNKWLIVHPESAEADAGAFVGILGDNIEILL